MTGVSTRQDIERHLTALADACSTHWTHRISDRQTAFVKIESHAPTVHQRDVEYRAGDGAYLGSLTEDHRGGYIGELVTGFNDPDRLGGPVSGDWNPMHSHGFTALLRETLLYQDREEWRKQVVSERDYPVAHVPIPSPTPRLLPAEISRLNVWNQPGRITSELAARLRMAGHDVSAGEIV